MVLGYAGWKLSVVAVLLSFLEVFVIPIPDSAAQGSTVEVAQWTRYEAQFTTSLEYGNPVQEAQVEVEFTSPSGKKRTVLAFWDGEKSWRVRFSLKRSLA
jgi:Domain of unknown function (DUF5060)